MLNGECRKLCLTANAEQSSIFAGAANVRERRARRARSCGYRLGVHLRGRNERTIGRLRLLIPGCGDRFRERLSWSACGRAMKAWRMPRMWPRKSAPTAASSRLPRRPAFASMRRGLMPRPRNRKTRRKEQREIRLVPRARSRARPAARLAQLSFERRSRMPSLISASATAPFTAPPRIFSAAAMAASVAELRTSASA